MNLLTALPSIWANFGSISKILPIAEQVFSGNATVANLKNALYNLPVTAITALEAYGSLLYPQLAPEFHGVAVLMTTFNADRVKWFQGAANQLLVLNPPLDVDGVMGPASAGAVYALQVKYGIQSDSWLGKETHDLIVKLLAGTGKAPLATPAPSTATGGAPMKPS